MSGTTKEIKRRSMAGEVAVRYFRKPLAVLGAVILASAIVYCGQLDLSGGALAVHTIRTAAAKCAIPFGKAVVLVWTARAPPDRSSWPQ